MTEITLTGGHRVLVDDDPKAVESAILSAARGSLMELAWVTEAKTGHRTGINPEHVLMLRVLPAGVGPA